MNNIYTEPKLVVGEEGERYHYEIFPDADGLDCVEIRLENWDDKPNAPIHNLVFPPEMARQIAAAMIKMADHLEGKAKLT